MLCPGVPPFFTMKGEMVFKHMFKRQKHVNKPRKNFYNNMYNTDAVDLHVLVQQGLKGHSQGKI